MNKVWSEGISSEFSYWWWQIKNCHIGKGEMAFRDSPLTPFDPFVESLIETCGPDGIVRILDVGAGPLSPLGEVPSRNIVSVTAVDALAKAFNKELDERYVGIGSPLRSRPCLAERLDNQFALESFDGVVCWNALDHMADPAEALRQMARIVRPGGFVYIWCWRNEGAHEKWRGLHQWNLDIKGGIPILRNRTGTTFPIPEFFLGFSLYAWTENDVKTKVAFMARRV